MANIFSIIKLFLIDFIIVKKFLNSIGKTIIAAPHHLKNAN
jgi:hypothetical protein